MRIEAPALTRRGFSFVASVGGLVVFTMTHRMWGFPEIPENLKWIVMAVLAVALAIYLVRSLSR